MGWMDAEGGVYGRWVRAWWIGTIATTGSRWAHGHDLHDITSFTGSRG